MPNLNAGRGLWVTGFVKCLNVRRLMYQTLIWPAVLRDEAGGLGAPFDTKRVQRLADALVDRMGRNFELGRDLFRRQMLVDEPQAIELAVGETRDPPAHLVLDRTGSVQRLWHARIILQSQSHPARHRGLPEQRVSSCLSHLARFRHISGDSSHFGGKISPQSLCRKSMP